MGGAVGWCCGMFGWFALVCPGLFGGIEALIYEEIGGCVAKTVNWTVRLNSGGSCLLLSERNYCWLSIIHYA